MVPAQAIHSSGMPPKGNTGVDWTSSRGLAWHGGEMAQEGQGLGSRLLLGLYSQASFPGPQTQPIPARPWVTCDSRCARLLLSGGPRILLAVTAARNCSSERDVRF